MVEISSSGSGEGPGRKAGATRQLRGLRGLRGSMDRVAGARRVECSVRANRANRERMKWRRSRETSG